MIQVVELPVGDLMPYRNNPRKNERAVPKVMESIRNFGFYNPIQIDRDKTVINGHTRLMAAKRLGMETVPCIYVEDLTEDQVRAMRLVDNRTSEYSQWDIERQQEELERILTVDMSEFDFSEMEEELEEAVQDKEAKPKVESPDYEPSESQWMPADLASADPDMLSRARSLISKVSDDGIRRILELRLGYLYYWDYERIADYHATQATPEERAAMEALAMVFLDEAGQVENGFLDIAGGE